MDFLSRGNWGEGEKGEERSEENFVVVGHGWRPLSVAIPEADQSFMAKTTSYAGMTWQRDLPGMKT